jgi:hypothetical protein
VVKHLPSKCKALSSNPSTAKKKKETNKQTRGDNKLPSQLRDYSENLHSNKSENLENMDNFLDTYDHPKLNQEDINHINRSITISMKLK